MKYTAATTLLASASLASAQGPPHGGPNGDYSSYGPPASITSDWASWTSAHPTPTVTDSAAWSSWASGAGFSSGAPSWVTQTTGAPWAGGYGPNNNNGTGRPGWAAGGGFGPFGHGGPQSGWGSWASDSTGSWTAGPWTSWWGTSACPASTWSGWTSGPWGTNAPWTTWSGCSASTTGSSVVTTTVTPTTGSNSGSASVVTTTEYGVRVAAATNEAAASGSASGSGSSGSSSAAAPTMGPGMIGSAAGALGVLAGAVLL